MTPPGMQPRFITSSTLAVALTRRLLRPGTCISVPHRLLTMGKTEADHELVQNLFKLQKKHGKLVRSSVYDAPEDPEIKVRSWKMSEHHYYKVPSPFPTLARGVFTTWVSNGSNKEEGQGTGTYRIVARGYDKFFNIGEVPWTTVRRSYLLRTPRI
jgi:tRNA splicing ligase